eukprot:360679-Chlamydomonas_euryale.AAC.5
MTARTLIARRDLRTREQQSARVALHNDEDASVPPSPPCAHPDGAAGQHKPCLQACADGVPDGDAGVPRDASCTRPPSHPRHFARR